ncbi:MAG: DUF4416 domain-containing protein [Aquificaceae bacterium]|nr:MAG: DUF4416 domain-containing protein [Aquificaceae bacterium]
MLVKPTFSVLYNESFPSALETALEELKRLVGGFDLTSEVYHFPHLERYYGKEMGYPLKRLYLSGKNLINADPCSQGLNPLKLKLLAMEIEKELSVGGNRVVNIDPGWVDKHHLFLTTHKERGGRFYLGKGIFAEMEYLYFGGDFRDLFWTYEDYRKREVKDFFLKVRRLYLKQLKEAERAKNS